MIIPLLILSVTQPVLPVGDLIRDPFYISSAFQEQQSRYDIRVPKIIGIVSVDGKKSAFVCFDDGQKHYVSEGDKVRGLLVMIIKEGEVVVRDQAKKETRWMM